MMMNSLSEEDIVTKIEKNMLRWSGHVKRMDKRRLTIGIWMVMLLGGDLRGVLIKLS
jgi:hypothetical protein